MPYFLNKNKKQFTVEQANESRMCSKNRCFVDATNSFLKQKFRALDATVQNKALPHYLIDLRITGALIKKYYDRLESDVGNTETVASNILAYYDKKIHYKISLNSMIFIEKVCLQLEILT